MSDDLGDRMKMYEARETERFLMPRIPVYARIDGRGFSKFTKHMTRPYDIAMSALMELTTIDLVEKTNATIGYTQSDEISLVWHAADPKSELFFRGKVQKMTSVLAGLATASFMYHLSRSMYAGTLERLPHFDARVFSLPTKEEAVNALMWRQLDATKNAISMAARSKFSHKKLQNKSGAEMQEMLFQEHGINFNNYPAFFRRGLFARRELIHRQMTDAEYQAIPEPYRPEPSTPVIRSHTKTFDLPPLNKVRNRVEVIFDQAAPRMMTEI